MQVRDRRGGMPSAEELLRLEVRERTTSLNRPADLTPPIPCQDAAAQALRDQSAIPMQDFDSFRAQFPSLSDSAVAAARDATAASAATPAASPAPRPPASAASAARAVPPDDEPPPRVLVSGRPWRDASASAAASSRAAVADVLGDDGGGDDDDGAVDAADPLLPGSAADDALLDALRRDMLLSLPDGDARRDAAIGLAGEGAARRGTAGGAARDDDDFEETVDLSAGGETATGEFEQRLGGRLAADGGVGGLADTPRKSSTLLSTWAAC